MSQSWKPLPDDLSEPARRLAEELRAVKDAHRISLAELGKRTYLSKASWERWLNGKRLITPQALTGLIAAVDCDAELLTSLLRQAEAVRDATEPPGPAPAGPPASAAPAPVPVPVPVPVPARPAEASAQLAAEPAPPAGTPTDLPAALARAAGWRRPPVLLAVAAVAVLVLVASLYLHGLGSEDSAAATAAGPAAAAMGAGPTPHCQGVGCVGKDPQLMGCEADDHTLVTGNIGKVVLYLHYSPRCRAAWAGITEGSPGNTATILTGTGEQETALIHWGYDNYSTMVDAGAPNTVLQVCGHQKDGDGCTASIGNPAARASAMPTPSPTPATATPVATPAS